jgi:hypothetical protein
MRRCSQRRSATGTLSHGWVALGDGTRLPTVRENTGAGIAIAGAVTTMLTLMSAVLVVLLWTALTGYALVKWIGSAPDAASPTTVLVLVVGIVTALVLLVMVPIVLLGRSMTPPRRRRDDMADRDEP